MNRINSKRQVLVMAAILFATAAMFVSCSEKGGGDGSIEITGGAVNQTVYADDTQGESKVTFRTTDAWTSTVTDVSGSRAETLWVINSPDHGDAAGDYTVDIHLADNYTGEDRTATIAIVCNDEKIDITVKQKGTTKEGEVPVSEGMVLNGVTWATCNVGKPGEFAATPQDRGGFYSFQSAQTACPAGWRLPTKKEFECLVETGYEYADMGYGEIENNYAWFGSGDDRLFFMSTSQGQGMYTSGTETGPDTGNAFCLYFGSNFVSADAALYGGDAAHSVRCVKQ